MFLSVFLADKCSFNNMRTMILMRKSPKLMILWKPRTRRPTKMKLMICEDEVSEKVHCITTLGPWL